MTQASPNAISHEGSHVDWPSILAGAVVAAGIAFVFTTFGAALGLTLSSPYDGDGSAMASLIGVGLWMVWTTVSSFMAGGYIAGRMRGRTGASDADEVGVRDGIHGLAVWGIAILLGAFLLSAGANTAVQATTDVAAAGATAAQSVDSETAQTATDTAGRVPATVDEGEVEAAAEAARKYSIVSAFVLAASLMIAAAGAYWAAAMGGKHRDEGHVSARFGRWT